MVHTITYSIFKVYAFVNSTATLTFYQHTHLLMDKGLKLSTFKDYQNISEDRIKVQAIMVVYNQHRKALVVPSR